MIRPTYEHPLGDDYARPGGPWDVASLPRALDRLDDRLAAEGRRWAARLRAAGVRRGEVVLWQLPNVPVVPALFLACWHIGAIAAPVHHQLGARELDDARAALRPRCDLTRQELPDAPAGDAELGAGDTDGAAPADLAVVLQTAGTTGEPKRVLHTHRALAYKARLMARVHGLGPDDVVLMPAPLAHVSGLLNGVLVPGAAGMRTVLMQRWEPEAALEAIEREGVTFMIGPPTFFVGLMDAAGFRRGRVASLRLVSCGGAGVSPEFVDRATEVLGAHVKRSYGSTEAPTVATTQAGDPPEAARRTDGRAVGAARLRVGDGGGLEVLGPELFAGYLDASQTRAAVTPDGWYRTGDRAEIDPDGFVTITGRLADVIIRGGENIAVAEVEAVLAAHPAVRAVAVFGVPDPLMGQRVAAAVVADPPFDLAACRRWFTERGVARFKAPERVLVLPELPLLPTGKPDRSRLRSQLGGEP